LSPGTILWREKNPEKVGIQQFWYRREGTNLTGRVGHVKDMNIVAPETLAL